MKRLLAATYLALASLGVSASPLPSGDDYYQSLLCARPPAPSQTATADTPDTRLRTRFYPQDWSAQLSKERFSATDQAQVLWHASEQFPVRRQIKITDAQHAFGLKDFVWSALDEEQQAQLNTDDNGITDGYGAARVRLLRGEDCAELDGCSTLRRNLPKLGDIVIGLPLTVAAPNRNASTMESYDGPEGAYAALKAKPRRAQVYVGANDGMLHAFDAATGQERLAIIPSAVVGKLSALTAPAYTQYGAAHRFFVDGPLVAQDVFFANAWHTILLASFGPGGRGLLALDVTDPDHVQVLWAFKGSNTQPLGYLLSAPTVARLHTGQWAVLLGNGIDAPAGSSALLLLDAQTGALIRRLPTPQPATGLAMPLVTDTNGDGNADYAYAGDNLGNLWRFDLYDTSYDNLDKAPPQRSVSANAFRLSYAAQPLFRTPGKAGNQQPQPITLAPTIVSHPSESGYLIIFGTGQNHLPADRDRQSLYGIWDRHTRGENTHTRTPVSVGDLQQQHVSSATGSHGPSFTLSRHPIAWRRTENSTLGQLGWYIDLQPGTEQAAGERLVNTAQRLGQLLSFSTRIPAMSPCRADIQRRLYVIDPAIGGSTQFPIFDINADGLVDHQDGSESLPPSAITTPEQAQIVVDPVNGMPCVLGDAGCAPLSLGPRTNGRQSWKVIGDGTP